MVTGAEGYAGVTKDDLNTIINKINSYNDDLTKKGNNLLAKLTEMKSSIIINNRKLNNGSQEIATNMRLYKTSYNGTAALFKNLINSYEKSVANAANYAERKLKDSGKSMKKAGQGIDGSKGGGKL